MAKLLPSAAMAAGLCRLEKRSGGVYILTLLGDGEHRIEPPLVEAMLSCLQTLKQDLRHPSVPSAPASSSSSAAVDSAPASSSSSAVLITTNEGRFFSNGLNLSYPSSAPGSFRSDSGSFQKLLEAYLNLPMPTIAAVCGHAAAAGFILALAHDHIVMRRDRGFLYMSEIDISILIPPAFMSIIRSKLRPRAFRDVVLCGKKFTGDAAVLADVVDSVHSDPEQTLEAAMELATQLASRKWNGNLYRDMREAMYPDVFRGFEQSNVLLPPSSSSLASSSSSSSSSSSQSSPVISDLSSKL